jgi:nucleoside phosphorylase
MFAEVTHNTDTLSGGYRRRRQFAITLGMLAIVVASCGSDEAANEPAARVVVLSAFPAELAPLLGRASIDETMLIEDRVFRSGTLAGMPVVLGLTGIGLANATLRASAVLERFDVAGVIVSGVGGSPLRIADVVVPAVWSFVDGTTYTIDAQWQVLAEQIAAGSLALERCTVRPDVPSNDLVCLPHEPSVVVGGRGQSTDPFGDVALRCRQGGDDVFGCDVEAGSAAAGAGGAAGVRTSTTPDLELRMEDMETAVIAREAAARGLPFIAFRAVSDGEGDPLELPGFPAQFNAYYRLAARNAAAVTVAFLDRIAARR